MFPGNVLSEAKQIDSKIIKCKDCGRVSECAVFCLKTTARVSFVPIKSLHKRYYALCPICRKYFQIEKR